MNYTWNTFSLRITWALLFYFGLLASVTAQVITGVNPNSGTFGQTINMIVTGSGTSFLAATGAYIHNSTGTDLASSIVPNSNGNLIATFNLSPNTLPGNYNLSILPVTLQNAFTVLPSAGGNYGYLSGKVILDNNSNCIQDGGDTPIGNKVVKILPGPFYASTDPITGNFGTWVPLGSYTVSTNISYPHGLQCPLSGSYSVNLTISGDSVKNLDFFLYNLPLPPPFSNLKVTVTSSTFRPGFFAYTDFRVSNTGNQSMSGYTLKGFISDSLSHYSDFPSATNVTGSTVLTWNLPVMNPGDVRYYSSFDSISALVPIGTILPISAIISPSDDDSSDNTWSGGKVVTGSFDPNDKQVWNAAGENGDGLITPNDTLLHYLIRCQNTGNDTAFNIFIRDTIDPSLDVSSLKVIVASHPYEMNVSGSGYVQFTFPNILLVDSATNEAGSHAYIEYSIEKQNGLPTGTQIDNTAYIYFDFNQPVVTNTVSSVICPEIMAGYSENIANLTATFTETSSGIINQYSWDFGDGNTSAQHNPVHSYASEGYYTVCLRITNSCGRGDSVCQLLTVGCPAPITDFIYTGNLSGMDFVDVSVGAPVSWLWDFGDGNTSTLQNPQHSFSSFGTYNVCLVSTNSCGSDSICVPVSVALGTPSTHSGTVEIFPNPNFGEFILRLEGLVSKNVKISMFDQVGHLILDNDIGTVSGNYSMNMDLSALPNGIYYLRIKGKRETITKKIIKQ